MMKTLNTYIRALFSLGRLGLLIGLLAIAVLVAAFSQSSEPFDAALERMAVLNALEADVALDLAEMQVQEARALFTLSYGLPSTGAAEKALEADARISHTLSNLAEAGSFSDEGAYITDLSEDLEAFNAARIAHRELFETLVVAFEEEDEDTLQTYLEALEEDNQYLDFLLRNLIIAVEHNRLSAVQDFPEDANASILLIVIGLALSLMLALAGYQVIAAAVRPLRRLSNAITAIAGDMYHPGELPKRGAAGRLAQALEALAQAEQARNEAAKKDIAALRQALYESRRRRLKIHQTGQQAE